MGCSASRCHTIVTRPSEEDPPSISNSSSSTLSSSSYSDSSSTPPPVSRTLSLPTPLVHHPPLCKGDSNHLVSLTSTTYGSLLLVDHFPNPKPNVNGAHGRPNRSSSSPLHSSKTLADLNDPSSPDSVINTWELMEGLDDDCDFGFDVLQSTKLNSSIDSCSIEFESAKKSSSNLDMSELVKSFEFVEHVESKPLWKHLSEESLLAKMDPNVASSYRRALSSRQLGYKEPKTIKPEEVPSNLKSSPSKPQIHLPNAEDRIVLYYTSLRGIRRTFEDCCTVRNIFKGFRVFVDERDISMDSMYRKELQAVLGGKALTLPQVFIRGKHIGGVDEIKQLHEGGDLASLLEGFAVHDSGLVCEICGDARFVPCPNCSGSRKVFEEEEGELRRCPECNENGLIRCPNCCC